MQRSQAAAAGAIARGTVSADAMEPSVGRALESGGMNSLNIGVYHLGLAVLSVCFSQGGCLTVASEIQPAGAWNAMVSAEIGPPVREGRPGAWHIQPSPARELAETAGKAPWVQRLPDCLKNPQRAFGLSLISQLPQVASGEQPRHDRYRRRTGLDKRPSGSVE